MTEISQSRSELSQVELLLDQQKYEEALIPLANLIEENPSDLQIRIYRLLTVRILLLRETLAQSIRQTAEPPRAIAQRMSSTAADTLQNFITPQLKQWFQSARRAIEVSRPAAVVRRAAVAIGVAGLFVTPVTFCLGVADQQLSGATESFEVVNKLSMPALTALNLDQRTPEVVNEKSLHGLAFDQLPRLNRINGDWGGATFNNWSIGASSDSGAISDGEPAMANARAAKEIAAPSKQRENRKTAKELHTVYKTRGSLSLREEPRFASASLQQISEGTHISVLAVNGKWLKVKPSHSNAVGYLRKEFLVAAN